MIEGFKNFLNTFYDTIIGNEGYKLILTGLFNTIIIAFFAVILGTILGCIFALMKISTSKILKGIANVYTTIIRGVPVVTQLMIFAFVVFGPMGVRNKLLIAIIGFGINSGAYVCEIFRAGIEGIDKGQMEAGRSLGLSYWQTMRKIILPQAIKAVLPTYTSEFIALIKETSIAGYIAVRDLTQAGDMIRNATYNAWIPLILVAIIYLILTMGLTKLFALAERRMKRSDRN